MIHKAPMLNGASPIKLNTAVKAGQILKNIPVIYLHIL